MDVRHAVKQAQLVVWVQMCLLNVSILCVFADVWRFGTFPARCNAAFDGGDGSGPPRQLNTRPLCLPADPHLRTTGRTINTGQLHTHSPTHSLVLTPGLNHVYMSLLLTCLLFFLSFSLSPPPTFFVFSLVHFCSCPLTWPKTETVKPPLQTHTRTQKQTDRHTTYASGHKQHGFYHSACRATNFFLCYHSYSTGAVQYSPTRAHVQGSHWENMEI